MKASITSAAIGAIVLAGAVTAQAQSVTVEAQSITETEGLPRLPNFFKNCEEPLPRYCVRPAGLLWFGSLATLQQERTAEPPTAHHLPNSPIPTESRGDRQGRPKLWSFNSRPSARLRTSAMPG